MKALCILSVHPILADISKHYTPVLWQMKYSYRKYVDSMIDTEKGEVLWMKYVRERYKLIF